MSPVWTEPPSPLLTYEKKDKGLVVLLEAAALLSVFFHLILNNILHDIQALNSRATIYAFLTQAGQWED